MEVIKFKDKEEFKRETRFFLNGERSAFYVYKDKLIKKYTNLEKVNEDKIKLAKNIDSDLLVLPEKLVSVDDKIVGYSMDLKRKNYPLEIVKRDLSYNQKYRLLLKIKKELIKLKSQKINYSLNLNNIITNGDEIYLTNATNFQNEMYDFDKLSNDISSYIKGAETIDGLEIYMLNMLTLYLYNKFEYSDIERQIEMSIDNYFNNRPYILKIMSDNETCTNICIDMFMKSQMNEYLIDNMKTKKI